MAQAYDAIIATIVVAGDATSVTKAMVKSTQWREGTSGDWLSTNCTLTAGNTYQFRTPLSGMSYSSTAILPNIKASVTVAWDTTATPISTVGNYFMAYYAYGCSNLTSLSVPDTSGLTSVGDGFMESYAQGCTNLTSLSVPDTSGLTSVGDSFMVFYAYGCTNLTSLSVPDTSGLTSVGESFMESYAYGCTNLTSLSVPDTSRLASVGDYFMYYYALDCSSLTSLILPDSTGWFGSNNVNWSVPSGRLGYLYGYAPNSTSQTAWQGLTVSGKTLYTNYIQDTGHVLVSGGGGTEADSERGLYIIGSLSDNAERGLYLEGKEASQEANSELGLYISGKGVGNGERGVYISGKDTASQDLNLYIQGKSSGYSVVGLYISGFVSLFSDVGLYISGSSTIDSERGLYVEGYDTSNKDTSLYIQGYINAEGDVLLYVEGKDTGFGVVGLYIEGSLTSNSTRGLYITGYSTSTSERGLYLQGYLTGNSTRGLYIEGFVDTLYSRESSASLKADDSNLSTIFSEQDYTDVATDDNIFVDLEGTSQYFQLLFKEPNGNGNNTDDFKITWKGKSSLAPSSSAVYLQIYNRTTESWTTLVSNSSANANTEFTLEDKVRTNLSDYYDENYIISVRVYQDGVV